MKELSNLKELRELTLNGAPVSDTGVAELKKLKQLKFLGLCGSIITKNGLKELRNTLPDSKVYTDLDI